MSVELAANNKSITDISCLEYHLSNWRILNSFYGKCTENIEKRNLYTLQSVWFGAGHPNFSWFYSRVATHAGEPTSASKNETQERAIINPNNPLTMK